MIRKNIHFVKKITYMKKIVRFEPYWGKWIFMHNGELRMIDGTIPDIDDIDLFVVKNKINPINGLSAPTLVQIQFTNRCNLACPHCYVNSGIAGKEELSDLQIKNLLMQLREFGVLEIQWSGGEVFSRKGFLEMVQYSNDLGFENSVLTNGYALGKLPDKFPPELLWSLFTRFQISMDGFEDHFNDWVGASLSSGINDAWKNVSNGVIRLYDYLVSTNLLGAKKLSVTTTLDNKNIVDLPKIAGLLSGKDIQWKLAKQIENGRSVMNDKNAFSVLNATYSIIQNLRKECDIQVTHPFDKQLWVDGMMPIEWQTEVGARWSMYVSANGDVYPFPYFDGVKEMNPGNVLLTSLEGVWYSPIFHWYRSATRENTGCANCPYICQMWARSFNYFTTRDILTPVPQHVNCPK
jgi:MoaA/NifB/PqqE/SkfB family radical SAM enzyme